MTLPAGMSSSAGATSFCASTGLRIRIFSPRRSTDSHRTRVSAAFGTTAPVAIAVHSPGPIVPVKGFPGNDSPTTVSETSSPSASVLASSKRIAKPSIAARRNPGTDTIAIAGCARRRPAAVNVEILSCGRQDSRSSISDNASATVQPSNGPVGDPAPGSCADPHPCEVSRSRCTLPGMSQSGLRFATDLDTHAWHVVVEDGIATHPCRLKSESMRNSGDVGNAEAGAKTAALPAPSIRQTRFLSATRSHC